MKCKHEMKYRQAVAAGNERYGGMQIGVVCLKCGNIIATDLSHDENLINIGAKKK